MASAHIETRELVLAYPGVEAAVDGVELRVPRGRITAVVGPNGCGKSTLLRGIARLLKPSEGSVLIDGRAIARLSTREIARRIGFLPQEQERPDAVTVGDLAVRGRYPHLKLLQQPGTGDHAAVTRALELTEMTALRNRPMDELSGGQRQRGWIAMALAQETPVMLLDEPTTYLDLAHRRNVLELLRRLRAEEERTIVVVLHELNDALRLADTVIVMSNGEIRRAGTPEDIVRSGVLEKVFGVDFEPYRAGPTGPRSQPYLVPCGECAHVPDRSTRSGEHFIEARNISFGYNGSLLFDKLSVSVPRGAVTGIIGPNGSGKSTLLRLLVGLGSVSAGEIVVAGTPVHALRPVERARRVGVLAQSARPPGDMTIEDLVSLGRHPYQRWFRQWSTADRDATAAAMSACGVGELRSRRADAVSGGQLQRARLAAALAQDTEFLALDEPTSFLDVRHQEETLSLARRINAQHDRTLLMVLHDVVHAARYTDYLIVLAAGRVVAAGAPTDVLTPTLVREVFGVDAALAYAGPDEVGLLLPLV